MLRSTFFQAGRRYEAWSLCECISPGDYCGWSTPLALDGEKKKKKDFTFPIILATKKDFKRLSIKLDVYQITIWCEN